MNGLNLLRCETCGTLTMTEKEQGTCMQSVGCNDDTCDGKLTSVFGFISVSLKTSYEIEVRVLPGGVAVTTIELTAEQLNAMLQFRDRINRLGCSPYSYIEIYRKGERVH